MNNVAVNIWPGTLFLTADPVSDSFNIKTLIEKGQKYPERNYDELALVGDHEISVFTHIVSKPEWAPAS